MLFVISATRWPGAYPNAQKRLVSKRAIGFSNLLVFLLISLLEIDYSVSYATDLGSIHTSPSFEWLSSAFTTWHRTSGNQKEDVG
jgi:hypothetical protein